MCSVRLALALEIILLVHLHTLSSPLQNVSVIDFIGVLEKKARTRRATTKWNNHKNNSCNFELGESNDFGVRCTVQLRIGIVHSYILWVRDTKRQNEWMCANAYYSWCLGKLLLKNKNMPMVYNNSWHRHRHRHRNIDIWGAYYHHKHKHTHTWPLSLISLTFIFIFQCFFHHFVLFCFNVRSLFHAEQAPYLYDCVNHVTFVHFFFQCILFSSIYLFHSHREWFQLKRTII